jgi:transcriptional regulator with PAS, ATPase and Fis domain
MNKAKARPKKATVPGESVWVKEFSGTVTVCDKDGTIVGLNDASAKQFADRGGEKLIGSRITDCHPEPARTKFRELMKSRRRNIYTIQKDGRKKLVFQSPWFQDGEFAGYFDLTVEIPWEMPHYNRDQE